MKQASSIFDSIRVKPGKERTTSSKGPKCEWDGCDQPGTHKAPKGRDREGQYFHFCVDHVKAYNKSYNYFSGMDDDSVRSYQRDSMTGHRPTWKMGVNSQADAANARDGSRTNIGGEDVNDPHNIFAGATGARSQPQEPQRKVLALEKRSFETLNLRVTARGAEIKTRYKELVKIHHPDANGGDRSSEDRLREIIQAYNVLKKSGYC
ncbi:Chaperone protein DnaJ [Pseudovibrio sp. W64]|uniref:J domain-containing protein n=1 Tax=unclassified Pseudovibrio TaxID=2627060 RepID=UPI00071126DF|nr:MULTISPECIES: DnaJ domain-containing protein [unclassified Pseudovibrio]KZK77423.1 Chaperone protein DnaJ [Pseudovibrio sp. W64]KZK88126.1 Chaperone protein DnaJ [Pseudovibrio sp. Ad13]KZK96222.1 Chaperone protein DnaJ [Pseudovibrio sp. Ad46]KZK99788.1 Chaperone protein DnaJ [Pseudovibrio sp. W74]KZL00966.1 Chaperone protein DnaJ [Pseudovibrio sp. Ad5]